MVSLMSIKTEIDYHFSDLNPFNCCPLVIMQVAKSSDMHYTTFSHLFKFVFTAV